MTIPDLIDKLAHALAAENYTDVRHTLMDGIDDAIVARLSVNSSPKDQALSDLLGLKHRNESELLPVVIFLKNAKRHLYNPTDKRLCDELIHRLKGLQATALLINPRQTTHWEDLIPDAVERQLPWPSGAWHSKEAPGSHNWCSAWNTLKEEAERLKNGRGPLHVFASTGYAIAAYAGCLLFDLPAREHHLYQPVFKADRWQQWIGPEIKPHQSPQLQVERDLNAPSAIAVQVSITHQVVDTEVAHGLAQVSNVGHVHLCTEKIGQNAISSGEVATRVAADLEDEIVSLTRQYPQGPIHVFYVGPTVILMKAARRWNRLATPITVHERVNGAFYPAVRFQNQQISLLRGGVPVKG